MQTPISMIDMTIVVVYLLITLFVGIKSGMGKNTNKTMKDYALGNRSFTTSTLTATLVATWLCSSSTLGLTTEIYNKSWVFGLVFLGFSVGIILTKYIFINRIDVFKNCLSTGDVIRKFYGDKSQTLVGFVSIIRSLGTLVVQIIAMGALFHSFLGINPSIGMIVGGSIITLYSAFGGIRGVIITDVIQFAVLVIAIPIVLNFAVTKVGGYQNILLYVNDSELFKTNLDTLSSLEYLLIFLSFCIPRLYPALIQRFLIMKNSKQLKDSLNVTAITITLVHIMIILIGICASILYSNIDGSVALPRIIYDLVPVGLKGCIIAGLLAVIMSTADSVLNVSSIAFAHDILIKRFGFKCSSSILSLITILIGIVSMFIALRFTSILDVLLYSNLFWYPVMLFPIILGVYGLRSSDNTFLLSSLITLIAVLIFHHTISISVAASTLFGVLFNLVTLLSCHFIYHKKINFITSEKKQEKKEKRNSINLLLFAKNLFVKQNETFAIPHMAFGVFVLLNYIFPYFTFQAETDQLYITESYLRSVSGLGCIILLFKDIWPQEYKKYFPIFWHINIIFTLPFMSSFILFANDFSVLWLAVFAIMLLLMTALVDWSRCLLFCFMGFVLSYILFSMIGGKIGIIDIQIKYVIFYLLAILFIIGNVFIKRKEDVYQSVIDEKDDLIVKQKNRLTHMNEVTNKALGVQHRILRNFSHELRTPMSSALSIADILEDRTIDDNMHTNSINVLHKSLNRFRSYIEDIMTIATGQEDNMPLTQTPTSITKLVKQAIKAFTTVDYPPKPIHIKTDVMDNVMANLDPNEIKRVLHIILDNAVRYSEDKVHITVNVQRQGNTSVRVSIADDGVGIPEEEKSTVFTPFIESKRTRLETGGKGLGLAVASNIIKAHKMGYIEARDNEPQGTEIFFDMECLPEGWKNPVKQADKTILLIDDDDSILLVHRYGMQKSGYRVIEAENGYIGMDMFEKYKDEIDIIIVDLMMPGFNGVEVINDIMNKYPEQYVKIIPFLHTGAAEGDYMREIGKLKDNKCVKILHKPIRTKDIIQAIEDRMEDCR